MKKRGWSNRIIVRYVLLQLPALILLILILILIRRWVNVPNWLFLGLVALWMMKDLILFPLTWRAYDWDRSRNTNPLVGEKGVAKNRLAPSGYVQIKGELWKAEVMGNGSPIEKGKAVRVQGIRGLTLLVQPNSRENETS